MDDNSVAYHVRISQRLQIGIGFVDHFSNKDLKRHHASHFILKRDLFDVAILRWCWIHSLRDHWFAIDAVLLRWWSCRCRRCCCRMAVSFHQPLLVARLRNRLHYWMESICRQCCRWQVGRNRQMTKTREGRNDGEEEDNGNSKGERRSSFCQRMERQKTHPAGVFSQLNLPPHAWRVTIPFTSSQWLIMQ